MTILLIVYLVVLGIGQFINFCGHFAGEGYVDFDSYWRWFGILFVWPLFLLKKVIIHGTKALLS